MAKLNIKKNELDIAGLFNEVSAATEKMSIGAQS
jgi:hypothetical protein